MADDRHLEAVPNPEDMVREQMSQAWGMMLSQLTQGGATRNELVEVTLLTARGILETTQNALWPVSEAVGDRPYVDTEYDLFTAVERALKGIPS